MLCLTLAQLGMLLNFAKPMQCTCAGSTLSVTEEKWQGATSVSRQVRQVNSQRARPPTHIVTSVRRIHGPQDSMCG